MAIYPTVSSGSKTTFDDTGNQKIDLADVIDTLDPRETPLLSLIGKSSLRTKCTETTHYWLEDQLIPSTAEVDAAYAANDLVFNPRPVGSATTTDGSTYFKTDDVVMVGTKHYQVTSVDATNALVYVRLISSSDAAAAVGDKMYILGNAKTEGSVARVVSEFTTLNKPYNYTQIFSDEVTVTGTQEVIDKYGYSSEMAYQEGKKLQEIAIKFERAALYGFRNSASSNNQPMRMMGGLYYFIRLAGGGTVNTDIVVNANSATITQETLDSLIEKVWGLGGDPNLIICNGFQARQIDKWLSPYIQTGINEGRLGSVLTSYKTRFGTLSVLLNRYVAPGDLIVCSTKFLGIGPLKDRAFHSIPIAKRGDSVERMILGEYTMEVRNYERAHGWIHSLATS